MTTLMKFDHIFCGTSHFERSMEFYKNALGFQVASQWGDESMGRGAILRGANGFQINFAEAHGSTWPEGSKANAPTLHFRVSDVDKLYSSIGPNSKVVVNLGDAHWGVRWFVVEDPSGVLLAFFSELKVKL
ncbi:VOC family protein [Mesorhizobium sp.]|uniref:VOC family protein n=1 Tax=Mesorhizobium sp. TaxID=1871066 RepID=UPI000FE80E2C|nr:VOC family protein [Mesorhizobium sp.]RWP37992.1 MAG: VOC family protein [Mesorhizobium sp.]